MPREPITRGPGLISGITTVTLRNRSQAELQRKSWRELGEGVGRGRGSQAEGTKGPRITWG